MWERFNEQAKQIVMTARDEAHRLQSKYVHTEHILLGLCREADSVAVQAMENLGVDIGRLAVDIQQPFLPIAGTVASGDIAFDHHAKEALEYAVGRNLGLNHAYVGAEHILLGLLRAGKGGAAKELQGLKVEFHAVQSEVTRILYVNSA